MSGLLLIRVNVPDLACAEAVSEALVREKLAACANISGPVRACYVWDGELQREAEYLVWVKAPAPLWPRIEARVRPPSWPCPSPTQMQTLRTGWWTAARNRS